MHKNAKLDEDEVIEIRKRYRDEDISQPDLGDEYDVTGATIGSVIRGDSYEEFGGPVQGEDYEPKRDTSRRFSDDEARNIRETYHQNDATMGELADKYDVSMPCISLLVKGETYKDAGGPTKAS